MQQSFHCRKIAKCDYSHVIELIETDFFPNETISKCVRLVPGCTFNDKLRSWLQSLLEQDISWLAIDKTNGQIAGVLVVCETTPESCQRKAEAMTTLAESNRGNERLANYFKVQKQVFNRSIFEMAQVEMLYELFILLVLEKYQRQGVANQLMSRAIEHGIAKGYAKQLCYATSDATYRIAAKHGFLTHRQVQLKDIIIDDQPLVGEEHSDSVRVMFK